MADEASVTTTPGVAAKRPHIDDANGAKIRREPLDASHRLSSALDKFHLLIGVTGSVATIKIQELIEEFRKKDTANQMIIKVCAICIRFLPKTCF